MSHFTVVVFTKDYTEVDNILAPFNENMEVKPYISRTKQELIDEFEECKKSIIEDVNSYLGKVQNGIGREKVDLLSMSLENFIQWYHGSISLDKEGNELSTYNPNSQWDWYTIGGRWNGVIRLKNRETTNIAQIKDIDFSIDKKNYDKSIRFWELKVEGKEPENESDKELIKWDWYKPEYYINTYKTKEEYARLINELNTYAVITPDGEWHSKGKMGWFGCSSESSDEDREWKQSFKEIFIDGLDPETYLVLVDCHI